MTATINYADFTQRANDIMSHLLSKDRKLTREAAGIVAAIRATYPVTPYAAEEYLIGPNELFRCGLFGSNNATILNKLTGKQERPYLHRHKFPLQGSRGGHIEYTGQALRQNDCDVYLALLHKEHETPGVVVVHIRQFAIAMGMGTGSGAQERLKDSIIRMSATNLEVNVNKLAYGANGQPVTVPTKTAFSLITGYKEVSKGVWAVYLPAALREMCVGNRYTLIQREYLNKLTKNASLAAWMLRYFSTHREPQPLSIEDLRVYCGSTASEIKDFIKDVKAALAQLKEVGFLESYKASTKGVEVVRSAYASEALAE